MERPLKVAVLGTGFIGQAHIVAWRQVPGVEVSILVDHTMKKAQDKAGFWGIPRWSTDWTAVVEDPEVDIIDNCLPTGYHKDVIARTASSGKPLYTEKPLVADPEELSALATVPDHALIGVNFNYRFYPQVESLRQVVSEGRIGRLSYAYGKYWQDWGLNADSRKVKAMQALSAVKMLVLDIGVHWIDLFEFVSADPITQVYALASDHGAAVVTVMFMTQANRQGCVSLSQGAPGYKNRLVLEVLGDRCAARWDQEMPDVLEIGTVEGGWQLTPRQESFDFARPTATPYPTGHVMGWSTTLGLAIAQFTSGVRAGQVSFPTATLGEATHNMLVVGAILRSLEMKKWAVVEDHTLHVS